MSGGAVSGEAASAVFRSFWMAGFESACHVNRAGRRLDLVAATQHDRFVAEDYARLRDVGIRTVRESMRWPLIERDGRYDFSSVFPFLDAAERHGIEVVWTLLHYGWPDDLDILGPEFVDRFARFAGAAARLLADRPGGPRFYSVVNEISFTAWAAGTVAYIHPFLHGYGVELKHQLVRAAIAATDAVGAADPGARFLLCEPLIRVIPPRDRPEFAGLAAGATEAQFEAFDMLAGRRCPELGGAPEYLDVVGANYYHANQWEYPNRRLRWEDEPRDPRWRPLHELLGEVYARYRRPLVIAETSHFGAGRARWIREIGEEVRLARLAGTPVEGVCLYPILDRHDWDDPDHWHNSGLWDVRRGADGTLERVLCEEYAEAFAEVRAKVSSGQAGGSRNGRRHPGGQASAASPAPGRAAAAPAPAAAAPDQSRR